MRSFNMKKHILLFAAALLSLCSCGPRSLSGREQTLEQGISRDYQTISIKGNVDVEVDDEINIMTITGDSNLLKLVKVKSDKKGVTITATSKLLRDASSPRVKVILPFGPYFKELKMDGHSSFKFAHWDIGPKLTIDTKGSNYVYGVMAMDILVIRADGSDQIHLDCICDTADIEAKGSSIIGFDGGPISADTMKIYASGTSKVYIEALNNISGVAEGASEIYIKGVNECTRLKLKDSARKIYCDECM